MKVNHQLGTGHPEITLYHMPVGSIGITETGAYYLRTDQTATCINRPTSTFPSIQPSSKIFVTILPPGTIITMEVE